jgi:putative PIN family toxin of toxin-antitoxin system
MKADRVVLDTNVLISATLIAGGTPARAVDTLHASRAVLLFSEATRLELETRLLRPKFDRYLSLQNRRAFLAQIDAISELVPIDGIPMACRDPSDDKFLETAVNGDADCLITGDHDLLVMRQVGDIPILSPQDFLARTA